MLPDFLWWAYAMHDKGAITMTVLKGAAFILAAMLCVIPCGVRADVVDTPIPKPTTGSVQRLAAFPSRNIPPRDVDVWLPPGYSDKKKYAVLYMQDGQMLFDAGITWNKQEWQADETAARLMAEGKTRPFLIVGIHNGGKRRHVEYFPQKPFEALPDDFRRQLLGMKRNPQQALFDGAVDSDAYLKFVVEELKPYIDAHFSVDTGPEHTAVMGSSMGGLISMYAISEYPQVFGAAACVSTHWPGSFTVENNPIPQAFFDYRHAGRSVCAPAGPRRCGNAAAGIHRCPLADAGISGHRAQRAGLGGAPGYSPAVPVSAGLTDVPSRYRSAGFADSRWRPVSGFR
jgi:predicted alpha/beta superfamily hydrolase